MIEPIEIDVQPFLQAVDLAIQYALVTVLVAVSVVALYALVTIALSAFGHGD